MYLLHDSMAVCWFGTTLVSCDSRRSTGSGNPSGDVEQRVENSRVRLSGHCGFRSGRPTLSFRGGEMVTDSAGVFSRSTEPCSKDWAEAHKRERLLSSTSHNSKRGEKVARRKGLEAVQVASRQIKSSPNLMVAVPNLIFLHWIQYVLGNVGGREGQYTTLSLLFLAKSSRAQHNHLILFSIKCGRLNSAVIKMAALWWHPSCGQRLSADHTYPNTETHSHTRTLFHYRASFFNGAFCLSKTKHQKKLTTCALISELWQKICLGDTNNYFWSLWRIFFSLNKPHLNPCYCFAIQFIQIKANSFLNVLHLIWKVVV